MSYLNLPNLIKLSLPEISNKIHHPSGRSTLSLILVNTGNKEPCTLNTQVIFIKLPFDMCKIGDELIKC